MPPLDPPPLDSSPLAPAADARSPLRLPRLRIHARAKLPSRFGEFEIVSFTDEHGRRLDDVAVLRGDVRGARGLATRVHSECLTGDALGSLRCDCRDQLELALERMARLETGLVLYMRQEGRGIGIAEKVKAYQLQDHGLDTVEANEHLGFDAELRRYDGAAAMLQALGVRSVVLHTNNPAKIEGLREHGIDVEARASIVAKARDENLRYLETKVAKMAHQL